MGTEGRKRESIVMDSRGCANVSGRGERCAQSPDRLRAILCAEHRRACDERVGARLRDRGDVVRLYTAVDFEPDVTPACLDATANLTDLVERRGDESLAAEARVHRHDEHEVDLV